MPRRTEREEAKPRGEPPVHRKLGPACLVAGLVLTASSVVAVLV